MERKTIVRACERDGVVSLRQYLDLKGLEVKRSKKIQVTICSHLDFFIRRPKGGV